MIVVAEHQHIAAGRLTERQLLGIDCARCGAYLGVRAEIPREQDVALYRDGQSMAALARRYGVSAAWLTARFREWGEPVRDRRAAQRVRLGRTLAAYRRGVGLPP